MCEPSSAAEPQQQQVQAESEEERREGSVVIQFASANAHTLDPSVDIAAAPSE